MLGEVECKDRNVIASPGVTAQAPKLSNSVTNWFHGDKTPKLRLTVLYSHFVAIQSCLFGFNLGSTEVEEVSSVQSIDILI